MTGHISIYHKFLEVLLPVLFSTQERVNNSNKQMSDVNGGYLKNIYIYI